MIVWLASYPRSGNTWTRIILHQLYGVTTYSIHQDMLFFNNGIADVVGQETLPGKIEDLRESEEIYFIKTHDARIQSEDKAIYIVRDGRDVAVSYARYQEQYNNMPFERALQRIVSGQEYPYNWQDHVRFWSMRPNTAVVKYENLIKNPTTAIQDTLGKLQIDLPVAGGELPTFAELKSKWPGFFRKGRIRAWKRDMPVSMQRVFVSKNRDALTSLGYLK